MKLFKFTPENNGMSKKLAKAAKVKEQTELPDADKQCVEQFKIALKVIDDRRELRDEVEKLKEVNDISTFQNEFRIVTKEVLTNIVPKTMGLHLRNTWNQFGLNRWGVATRNRYSSRFESATMQDLLSAEKTSLSWHTDLDEAFRHSSEGDNLPKEFKNMTPTQIYLRCAIDALKKSKFRTRKRSVERLERLYKYVTKNEALLKKTQDRIRVDVGTCFVWNADTRYGWRDDEKNKGFTSGDYEIEYKGHGNITLRNTTNNDEEFELRNVGRKLDHAFAFANLYEEFPQWMEKIQEVKEERGKVVKDAIEELRTTFAKELLIAKAKTIMG